MKIAIIGTTSYLDKMKKHAARMVLEGHEVTFPALNSRPDLNSLEICIYNMEQIESADRVDFFWDCRSPGALFDFGMIFALGIPLKIIYLESKTFMDVLRGYEAMHEGLQEEGQR